MLKVPDMTREHRVLIAARNPALTTSLHTALASSKGGWRVVGIVDPTVTSLTSWSHEADSIVIGGDDFLWLWRRNRTDVIGALFAASTIVMLAERQILDVVSRSEARVGLVLRRPDAELMLPLISVAEIGYFSAPEDAFARMMANQARLDIVRRLTLEEMRTLGYLGDAKSNRAIARAMGLSEMRVKTLVHIVTRKLRCANRTAVAVFAAANGFAANASSQDGPYT